jgi:hypothetical protein
MSGAYSEPTESVMCCIPAPGQRARICHSLSPIYWGSKGILGGSSASGIAQAHHATFKRAPLPVQANSSLGELELLQLPKFHGLCPGERFG